MKAEILSLLLLGPLRVAADVPEEPQAAEAKPAAIEPVPVEEKMAPAAPVPVEEQPYMKFDIALTLIYLEGDALAGVKAGQVTTECLHKGSGGTDQLPVLFGKIRENPVETKWLDGIFATLNVSSRTGIMQVRMPDAKYCKPFVKAHKRCFQRKKKVKGEELKAVESCVTTAGKSLKIKKSEKEAFEQLYEDAKPALPHTAPEQEPQGALPPKA